MAKEKVACVLCGYKDHILVQHVQSKHGLEPLVYLNEHPGSPLWSTYGYDMIRLHNTHIRPTNPRARERVSIEELFPDFATRRNAEKLVGKIARFVDRSALVPQLNPHYLFPIEQTLNLICILEKPARNRAYIKGPSGTGKTELCFAVAAKLNAPVLELNADSHLQRSDVVGHWTVRDGATVWQDGIVPTAMRRGYWLIINELDASDPHTLNTLKPVFEDPPRLTILENGGEVVRAHPDFRCIATGNTWGRGDASGMFTNTLIHSIADMRRWNARIELDYPAAADEIRMLQSYFGDDIEAKHPPLFVQFANSVRDAFKSGKIQTTLSPGEVVNWVENCLVIGEGVHHAARLSFLNACEPSDKTAISEMLVAVFGDEPLEAP